ncbi:MULTISPECIES: hypothetical protein [unclassified Paraburkholderia]|uniref:hypothetical protein n=1 Tax=unclassified Paraburkholderia TaxID=2615204 RepID=UPI002AAF2D89|nr:MULTISPECIES: hypothetical protein [unclassified Paraburkholderia]
MDSNGIQAVFVTAMKQRRVPVVPRLASFGAFLALLGLCAPLGAQPQQALDKRFDCTSNPHEFISTLIEEKSIDPSPSRVEANSVNAFRPVHGSRLSAFGFPIYVVLGYARDDDLFHRGAGKEIKAPLYGVVVSAPAESVRSRVSEANSDATVKSVVPLLLTAIVCGG